MRTESLHADDLAQALRRGKIATMPELKKALGTAVDVTVFRKLKQLAYRTSYSHRGSYYALNETLQFDSNGLFSFQSVWFFFHEIATLGIADKSLGGIEQRSVEGEPHGLERT